MIKTPSGIQNSGFWWKKNVIELLRTHLNDQSCEQFFLYTYRAWCRWMSKLKFENGWDKRTEQ